VLKELTEGNNGLLIIKDAVAAGIPKVYLRESYNIHNNGNFCCEFVNKSV
jgi:hypothetical protein